MSKKRPTRSIYLPPALKQRQAIQKACGRQSVRDKQQNDDILEKFKKFQIDDMTSKERYVDIYANHTSHEHLLKDTKQIITYRSAILGNRHLFRDKVNVIKVNKKPSNCCMHDLVKQLFFFPDCSRCQLRFRTSIHVCN